MQDSFYLPASQHDMTPLPDLLWRDTGLHRLMLSALLSRLKNQLLLENSATQTLDAWCRQQKLASASAIRAVRVNSDTPAPPCPPELAEHLQLTSQNASETLRYRHVRLICGALTLSHAENWYRPDRLTKEMNTALETTETPFGLVTTPLGFSRRTLAEQDLWDPLPDITAGMTIPDGNNCQLHLPRFLFRHQAILKRHDAAPFSAVIETYTSDLLRFTPPHIA